MCPNKKQLWSVWKVSNIRGLRTVGHVCCLAHRPTYSFLPVICDKWCLPWNLLLSHQALLPVCVDQHWLKNVAVLQAFPPLSLLPPISIPLLSVLLHVPPSVLYTSPRRLSTGSWGREWTEALERKLDQEMRFPVAAQIKAPLSSSQAGKDIITLTTRDIPYLE